MSYINNIDKSKQYQIRGEINLLSSIKINLYYQITINQSGGRGGGG